MRRILAMLDIKHDRTDPVHVLRKKLHSYIITLRKGKRVEREQHEKDQKITRFNIELKHIRESWPQLVPHSLKDKIIHLFREQTSSKALTTFACASCAESVPLRSQRSLATDKFDIEILKQPNLRAIEDLLDRYKCLHPDCIAPPPFNDGPLKDILFDPDGVVFPADDSAPILSGSVCHSSLKKNKLPPLALANKLFLGALHASADRDPASAFPYPVARDLRSAMRGGAGRVESLVPANALV
jgi:hypothetical protein